MSATQVTSVGQARTTMMGYLDALFGGGDYGAYLTADATFTMMESGEVTHGRQAIVGLIDYLHKQAFAATPELTNLVVDESSAIVEVVFNGTHAGEFAGIAPTGRAVRVPYAVAYDLHDGAITALRIYLSMDALVRQIRAT